jgi:hypothetical protein
MTLEELIAAQTKSANADTEAAVLGQNQAYDSSNAQMQTEQGEIDPYYNSLINDTNKAYKGALGQARTSAAGRGAFWGSGGLSNVEMSMGSENAGKVSEYGAERTRKLADIGRRRSLLIKERDDNIKSLREKGAAGLESSIATLRYDAYQTEQANAQRMREIYAQNDGSSSNMPEWAAKAQAKSGAMADIMDFFNNGEDLKTGATERVLIPYLREKYGYAFGNTLQDAPWGNGDKLDELQYLVYNTRKPFEDRNISLPGGTTRTGLNKTIIN